MNLAYNAAVLVLAVGLFLPTARAGDQRPIVAVFDIEDRTKRLKRQLVQSLTEYLGNNLGEGGIYQIVPPGDIKRALRQQVIKAKKDECTDQSCQIEIGRELQANKTLSNTISRIGKVCMVGSRLYDLQRMATETTATAKGPCTPSGLMKSVENVVAKLREWGGGTAADVDLPPTDDDTPAPSSDSKEYKRALNQAWRKLARAVRKGTTEQKLEKYQEFLAEYPEDNPYEGKVQKNIDALETKLERQEEAKRKAEEKKAALEVKRQRAKEVKEAYNQAKAAEGSATEKLAAWKQFVSDYPDKNPYLKTARRKVKTLDALEARLEKQEEARREAEEKKAALEARRAKAREIQQAYDRVKQTKGSASTQLQAWESFVSDYPDDNPYLKTARRKIKTLERRSKAEAEERERLARIEAARRPPDGFVRIPSGSFQMGSPASEDGRFTDETQHRVTITRAFLMQATEVTQGQYRSLMGKNPSHFTSCGDDCPVETVSWREAVAYCNALSRKEGLPECYDGDRLEGLDCKGYRLPTEAEWEYAARAGSTGARYGDLDSVAWYDGNSGSSTHPVGKKKPNAWGLSDMLGNVNEWCHDWNGDYSSGSATDPTGPQTGSNRVRRGGSWSSTATAGLVRAALRDGGTPDYRNDFLGLRPARFCP